jgi:hypothetical protein
MGLFDFVKGIGKKNTAPAEPQPAPATPAEPSAHIIVYSKVIKLTFIVILQKSYTSAIN